jgi:hypothetical protein
MGRLLALPAAWTLIYLRETWPEVVVHVDFLYGANEWIIAFLLLVFMLAVNEAGFRLGRHAESRTTEKTKSEISVVAGSIVGVLGLLLGFTMSMAVARFEARKQLVLEEANAIGTSYLRTQLLPAPDGPEIASLLSDYVNLRVEYARADQDLDQLKTVRRQTARVQNEFWVRAVAYAQKDPNQVRAGLILQSLNQVIDLEAARWMTFLNRVPASVIYVNGVVALLAVNLVGYGFGVSGRRQFFSACLLAVAISVVLAVILDLDRPRHGFIQVSQQPMIDLQDQLRTVKQ